MTEGFAIVSLLGLALGSFLNSCAYRLPRKISLVTVRSFCPHCGHGISWLGLVPILGFALNRGCCKSCNERISLWYPLSEFSFTAIVVGLFVVYGLSLEFVLALVFAFLMVLVAIIDAKHFLIPNELIAIGFVTGIAYAGVFGQIGEAMLSGVGCMLLMLAIRMAGNSAFKRESMGMGDVKLPGVIGLFLGFVPFMVALWLASIVGMIYGLVKIRNSKSEIPNNIKALNLKQQIPFGSFMALSSLCVFVFKENVLIAIESWLTLNP